MEYARRYYNGSVRDYNSAVQSFPGVLMATPFGFRSRAFYDAEDADRQTPAVMYHLIARNKRLSIVYTGLFALIWLGIGAAIGALA